MQDTIPHIPPHTWLPSPLATRAQSFNQSLEQLVDDRAKLVAKRETIRAKAMDGTITRSEVDTLRGLADDALLVDIAELRIARNRSALMADMSKAFVEYIAAVCAERDSIAQSVEKSIGHYGQAAVDAALCDNERWAELARIASLDSRFVDDGAGQTNRRITELENAIQRQIC